MIENTRIKPGVVTIAKRPPEQVMRLARMGSFHQSRLSFMRVLLRRLKKDGWRFDRPLWRIDANGLGVATYRARGPERIYTLVAFAHDLPADLRSDRVIAEAWDATFTLVDGEASEADIARLSGHVPVQEAGRLSEGEFVLSRANRSVRLFEHVVDALSKGGQPDPALIEPVGYLMRTTAVYGSGKFGAADRSVWADRPEFTGSFQPELLSVWLIRCFTIDLAEHMAVSRSPDTAVALEPSIRRRIGVGNSTGLGMAPFLLNHPALIHSWINARETALSRVRGLQSASAAKIDTFLSLVGRAAVNAGNWRVEHEGQARKCDGLRADFETLKAHLAEVPLTGEKPWDALYCWSETALSLEGQEQLVSLMLEPYPELVDDLAGGMSADETILPRIDGTRGVQALKEDLRRIYAWALGVDFDRPEAQARVWYVSEEKLEPRLGERFEEALDSYEQPLSPGRDAMRALSDLEAMAEPANVAEFLLRHPEHRHTVRRVQLAARNDYAEIRDNTISQDMLPIDLLRCKLSFFGATKFDPRSDRWVRITMFQGAPFPDELGNCDPDDLAYPPA